jgi:NADH-quinone oxidoreductase subunit H
MTLFLSLFHLLIFPGFLFLCILGWAAQFADRKLYARMQNRVGPPWFQPAADFLKLVGKECIIPEDADRRFFSLMPPFALAAAVTASFYIPLWSGQALFSFPGDVIVVLYLLTLPTLAFFLGGWYSTSLFSSIGAVRTITQLFAYEIPLFLAILAPALLANTWSLSAMTEFYRAHPLLWLANLPGFAIALVVLLGKLEKVPFDIPEAETEIVAGRFTEYSGWLLALFKLALEVELAVVASLLAAVFLPFGIHHGALLGFVLYLLKVSAIVAVLSLLRTVFARLRIDQMIRFCWKIVAPAAFAQVLLDLLLKGLFVQ